MKIGLGAQLLCSPTLWARPGLPCNQNLGEQRVNNHSRFHVQWVPWECWGCVACSPKTRACWLWALWECLAWPAWAHRNRTTGWTPWNLLSLPWVLSKQLFSHYSPLLIFRIARAHSRGSIISLEWLWKQHPQEAIHDKLIHHLTWH